MVLTGDLKIVWAWELGCHPISGRDVDGFGRHGEPVVCRREDEQPEFSVAVANWQSAVFQL